MNNIYLPDGFPNTPDVKDLGGQYTAGDGIAIGSDGSISVEYGPGLGMTTTDKLTVKPGNGLELSGEELAAKIGNGLEFSSGAVKAKLGDGLSFDANNAIKGFNGITLTTDGLHTYSSVTIKSGGYAKVGKLCFVSMVITSTGARTGYILYGFPTPAAEISFPLFKNSGSSITSPANGRLEVTSGTMNADSGITSGDYSIILMYATA